MRRFLRTPQNARGRFAGPWSLEWASGDKSRTSDLVNLHPQADRKWGFWVMLTGLLRGSQDFWFTDWAAASEAHSKTYHQKQILRPGVFLFIPCTPAVRRGGGHRQDLPPCRSDQVTGSGLTGTPTAAAEHLGLTSGRWLWKDWFSQQTSASPVLLD